MLYKNVNVPDMDVPDVNVGQVLGSRRLFEGNDIDSDFRPLCQQMFSGLLQKDKTHQERMALPEDS